MRKRGREREGERRWKTKRSKRKEEKGQKY
jgi:hypothetical protein